MARVVADLGNTRLKWGLVDDAGRIAEVVALPLNETPAWVAAWQKWTDGGAKLTEWTISSVNPPKAQGMQTLLKCYGVSGATWFRSAADVGVRHELTEPEDRGCRSQALAVAAAIELAPRPARPGCFMRHGHHDRANLGAWRLARRCHRAGPASRRRRLARSHGHVAAGRATPGACLLGRIHTSRGRGRRLLGYSRRSPRVDRAAKDGPRHRPMGHLDRR